MAVSDFTLDTARVLTIQDGDVIVITTDHPLTALEVYKMKARISGMLYQFGKRVEVLILDPSVALDLVTDDRAKRIRAILDE